MKKRKTATRKKLALRHTMEGPSEMDYFHPASSAARWRSRWWMMGGGDDDTESGLSTDCGTENLASATVT